MKLRFILLLAAAGSLGACAEAGDSGGPAADARTFDIADSSPGSPDAPINSTPDAAVGTPDAMVGSPDASVTPDAMTTPDAAGCTTQTVQLLTNANLDLGPGNGWVENGAGYPVISSDAEVPIGILPFPSGTYGAWLGGLDGATMFLYQDVVIPASATNMSLTGYRFIASQEPINGAAVDTLTVQIRNTSNVPLETLAAFSDEDANDAWTTFSATAGTPYAGQTIRVYFQSYNDAVVDTNTNFFLDSFALNVLVCQ